MTGSVFLDILIGLFLVYFILSSMASVISELIGMFIGRRARTMAQFIIQMFNERSDPNRPNATKFYGSTLFLTQQIGGLSGWIAWLGRKLGIAPPLVANSEQVLSMSSGSFSQAVFEVLNTGKQVNATLDEIRKAISDLPDSAVKDALVTAVQQAGSKAELIAGNVEKWFDGQMAQLSALYQRQTRVLLFFIGLALAILLNVDSIAVYQALQNNPTLRNFAVQQAQVVTQHDLSSLTPAESAPSDSGISGADELAQQLHDLNVQLADLHTQLDQLGLPIGLLTLFNSPPDTNWWSKALGLLISGVAVTLGAQFWFDALRALSSSSESSKS